MDGRAERRWFWGCHLLEPAEAVNARGHSAGRGPRDRGAILLKGGKTEIRKLDYAGPAVTRHDAPVMAPPRAE